MAKFKNPANRINSEYPSASAPYIPTTTSPVSNTTKVHLSGAKQVHEGDAARYHVELDLSPIGKNVFIVSAVNYRHEQKNLPKRYQSRAICASPSPAGKCP